MRYCVKVCFCIGKEPSYSSCKLLKYIYNSGKPKLEDPCVYKEQKNRKSNILATPMGTQSLICDKDFRSTIEAQWMPVLFRLLWITRCHLRLFPLKSTIKLIHYGIKVKYQNCNILGKLEQHYVADNLGVNSWGIGLCPSYLRPNHQQHNMGYTATTILTKSLNSLWPHNVER